MLNGDLESLLDFARHKFADDYADYVGGITENWHGVPVWATYNPCRDKYLIWACEETWTANDALRYILKHNNLFRDGRYIEVRALVRGDNGQVLQIEVAHNANQ